MSDNRNNTMFLRVVTWLLARCSDGLVLIWRVFTLPAFLYGRREAVERWQEKTRKSIADVCGEVTFHGDVAVTMEPDAVCSAHLIVSYIVCDRHGVTCVLATTVEKSPAEAFATFRLWNEFYSTKRFRPKWWKPIPDNVRKPA